MAVAILAVVGEPPASDAMACYSSPSPVVRYFFTSAAGALFARIWLDLSFSLRRRPDSVGSAADIVIPEPVSMKSHAAAAIPTGFAIAWLSPDMVCQRLAPPALLWLLPVVSVVT